MRDRFEPKSFCHDDNEYITRYWLLLLLKELGFSTTVLLLRDIFALALLRLDSNVEIDENR